jgi:single-stranded DNA-binding protein
VQTRNYTDGNGQKRYLTEVIVEEALFVDSKSDKATGISLDQAVGMQKVEKDDDLPF